MQELSREIEYRNLNYHFAIKASGLINFIKFKGPFSLFKKIRDRDISLEMVEEDQEKLKREFSQTKLKIIDLFNNYSKIKSESIYRSKHDQIREKGLKILTPKQMLQRLPVALTQVKAGNNSESLLNEIRQILYYLYQSKQITKKRIQ